MRHHIPESSANIIPIILLFKENAKNIYGRRLKKIILYGSYARGLANKDSDIDLMVVLTDMESAFAEIEKLSEIKFPIILENDIHISVNPVTENIFLHSKLPIFNNIAKEGIEI